MRVAGGAGVSGERDQRGVQGSAGGAGVPGTGGGVSAGGQEEGTLGCGRGTGARSAELAAEDAPSGGAGCPPTRRARGTARRGGSPPARRTARPPGARRRRLRRVRPRPGSGPGRLRRRAPGRRGPGRRPPPSAAASGAGGGSSLRPRPAPLGGARSAAGDCSSGCQPGGRPALPFIGSAGRARGGGRPPGGLAPRAAGPAPGGRCPEPGPRRAEPGAAGASRHRSTRWGKPGRGGGGGGAGEAGHPGRVPGSPRHLGAGGAAKGLEREIGTCAMDGFGDSWSRWGWTAVRRHWEQVWRPRKILGDPGGCRSL